MTATLVRSSDIISGNEDLEPLDTIKDFPVFMGCVQHDRSKDLVSDYEWVISRSSGMIQLRKLLPLDVLYQSQHAGAIGTLWSEHHKSFAKFIATHTPNSVLEIGGAHGLLSKEYMSRYNRDVEWTILEPNPTPFPGVTAKFVKGFFDDSFCYNDNADTIIHSHVFEHVYDPIKFVKDLGAFTKPGNTLLFSVPNMLEMLKRKYTNCLNFEHTMFLTEPYIEHLLSKFGFRLQDKQYFQADHSIFYSYVKDSNCHEISLPDGLYEYNKHLYSEYLHYYNTMIDELNENILEDKSRPIYLFGAHIFSQYLIMQGLSASNITCILDNDPKKQKLRLYGTDLIVDSPKILTKIEKPVVILKAGVYNNEIKQDIIENINPHTEFW